MVRDRRRDLHLTQEGLAERMGGNVHQGDISQIERGVVAYPRRERLAALAAALELPYETVFAASGWGNAYRATDGAADAPPAAEPLLAELTRVFGRLSEAGRTSVVRFAGYLEREERNARRQTKRRAGDGDD